MFFNIESFFNWSIFVSEFNMMWDRIVIFCGVVLCYMKVEDCISWVKLIERGNILKMNLV